MSVKKTTGTAAGELRLIPVNAGVGTKNYNLPVKRDLQWWGDVIQAEFKKLPKVKLPYLTLSAAATKVKDKGWLNAINCRNMFADGPNIDFLPQDSFGGKIEVWMENVSQGDSFTVQFRVVCGYNGNWKISSSETSQFQTAIVPVSQSIDFLIPPVSTNYGLVLITLEPLFSGSGSWVFNDVIINKISF